MSTPAGWYADPVHPTVLRWWDGSGWSAHTRAAAPVAAYVPPRVDVPTTTPWSWLAVMMPLVPVISLLLLDYRSYFAATLSPGGPDLEASLAWISQSLAFSLLGWVATAASIVFCWLDWRALSQRGVQAPFHWGWSFFVLATTGGLGVYIIGRAVVLKRRTVEGGWIVMWVWIAVTVVAMVVVVLKMVAMMGELFAGLAPLMGA